MSKVGDLFDKAKHLVVEDDDIPKAAPATHSAAPTSVSHPAFNLGAMPAAVGAAPAPTGSPFSVPTVVAVDEKVYQGIFDKTNFDTTPIGKTIHGYYDGLEDMDVSTRFKTAFKLAVKRDGVTADQVLSTFDQMQSTLDFDAQSFQKASGGFETGEITNRQTKIASLQQQVESINQQIAQLNAELADAQVRHGNATTQYSLAQQKRVQEIAAQKALFASLLR